MGGNTIFEPPFRSTKVPLLALPPIGMSAALDDFPVTWGAVQAAPQAPGASEHPAGKQRAQDNNLPNFAWAFAGANEGPGADDLPT